jgi:hypothetical protein
MMSDNVRMEQLESDLIASQVKIKDLEAKLEENERFVTGYAEDLGCQPNWIHVRIATRYTSAKIEELETKLITYEKCLEAKNEGLKHFVDKVEHGHARSVETYAVQKQILKLTPEDFSEEKNDKS